jgi:hypothetical protein
MIKLKSTRIVLLIYLFLAIPISLTITFFNVEGDTNPLLWTIAPIALLLSLPWTFFVAYMGRFNISMEVGLIISMAINACIIWLFTRHKEI